jgi:hypothetical protein
VIAIDTSSLQRYLSGAIGADVERVARALVDGEAFLPPAVVVEALSDPVISGEHEARISAMALLPIRAGFWHRAGTLRRSLKRLKLKGGLGDTLIAQSCIDADIPLITYDRDFRHFERAGLKLL